MKKISKRAVAIWIVLALCLALVPMETYAEEPAAEQEETVQAPEPETKKEDQPETVEEPTSEEASEEGEEPLEEILSDELVITEEPGESSIEEPAEGQEEAPADSAEPENEEEQGAEEEQEAVEETMGPEDEEDGAAGPEEGQEQEGKEEAVEDTGVYAKGSAKLYEKPSTGSELLATLDYGTVLVLYETEGDWALVQAGDLVGYIFRDEISGVKFPDKEENEAADETEGMVSEEPSVEDAEDTEPAEDPEAADAEESETQEDSSMEPAEAENAEVKVRSVKISSSVKTVMTLGETVTLSSQLKGFEDCEEIYYQWEVDKGNGFETVEGATSGEYRFTATQETLSWSWRLSVKCR